MAKVTPCWLVTVAPPLMDRETVGGVVSRRIPAETTEERFPAASWAWRETCFWPSPEESVQEAVEAAGIQSDQLAVSLRSRMEAAPPAEMVKVTTC